MLEKDSVLNAQNICGDPICRCTETAESPVHDDEIPFRNDRSWLIFERRRKALDEMEQPLTTRCNVSAVLNVVRGPIALGRYVVSFVEESVESLEDECFVSFPV